jgi:hypothetical protein
MLLDTAAFLAMKRRRLDAAGTALGPAGAAMAAVAGARPPDELRARSLTLEGLQLALTASDLQRLMQAGAQLSEDAAASLALEVRC